MNRTATVLLALGSFLGFASGTAQAELITFDNLPVGSSVPVGYGGLTWHNLQVVNATQFGVVPASSSHALFTFYGGDGEGAAKITPAGAGMFTFVGAAFASVADDLVISALGSRNGLSVYTASFAVRQGTLSFETLNFRNIDSLSLTASFVTPPRGQVAPSAAYLIENFTTGAQTAPEPSSLLLFGIGTAATGLAAFRRHRRLKASPD